MQAPTAFFRAFAKSIRAAVGSAEGGALVPALPRFAGTVWEAWSRVGTAADRRVELLALARAPAAAIRALSQQIAGEIDGTSEYRARLAGALNLVPRLVRDWLRRHDDPRGLSMTTAMSPFTPEDILPLIPARLPRFKTGDAPLAGGSRVLVELLGFNAFGETWLAKDPKAPAAPQTVLKFCLDPATAKRMRGKRGLALLDALRQNRLGGAVALQQSYLDISPPCLEYEYLAGGDLAGLAYQLHFDKAPPDAAHRLIHRLAKNLGAGHRLTPPIVHGNLKASNVLVQPRPDKRVSLRIADYGFDDRPIDRRADVFALAVLWCQMLLGDMARPLPPVPVWRHRLLGLGVATAVLDLLQECLDEAPEHRPADAAVLADRIDAALRTIPAAPAPMPTAPVPAEVPAVEHGKSAVEWFADGNRALEEKHYAAAVRAFSQALAAGYDEAAIRRQRAAALVERHRYARAEADLDRLVALRGNELESYLLRGECRLLAGKIDDAIRDFTQAVQINPRSARVYVGRGRACLARGEMDLAFACFEKAQKRDQRDADAWRYRGDAWLLKGDLDRAFEDYTMAIHLKPEDPKLHMARGEVCLKQDRVDQAVADFTEAIRLDPSLAAAHHGRARAFMLVEHWDDALFDLRTTLRLDRRNVAALRDRAGIRIRSGRMPAALRDYTRIMKLEPHDARAFAERGWLWGVLGRQDRGIVDFNRAIRRDRTLVDAWSGRGRIHQAKGEIKKAVRDFSKVVKLRPDSVEAWLERAWAYLDAKRFGKAQADAREVLRREPTNPGALSLQEIAEKSKRAK